MAWLSLVIVAVLFHNPVMGALPLFVFDIPLWACLWIVALLLERAMQVDLLSRLNLQSDLVYALRPSMSNRLAEYLALVALGVTAARAVIPIVLGWGGLLIGGLALLDGSAALASFSLLVLIAGRAFRWEQRYRRELDIRRNQLRRKHEQRSIVIPPTQHRPSL